MLPSFLSECLRKLGVSNVHFLSRVDVTAWISRINNIGPRLLPCFTPTVPSILTSSSPTFIVYVTLECSFLRMTVRLSGIPYSLNILLLQGLQIVREPPFGVLVSSVVMILV